MDRPAIDIGTCDSASAMTHARKPPRADRHLAERPTSRRRVLLIEDDPFISSLVTDELADCGYDVVGSASDLAQALLLAEAAEIDAALVDLNLHGEFASGVIAILMRRRVPFVVMTAYSALPDGVAAPLLEKPFTRAQLLAALDAIFPDR